MTDPKTLAMRVSEGMNVLAALEHDDTLAELRAALPGVGVVSLVQDALAAIRELMQGARSRDPLWPERRERIAQVLDQMEDLLKEGAVTDQGVTDEVRQVARSFAETFDLRSVKYFDARQK
jgi:hypothetical protein